MKNIRKFEILGIRHIIYKFCKFIIKNSNTYKRDLIEIDNIKKMITFFEPKDAKQAKGELRLLQLECLKLLKLFDEFATQNNFRYWIDCGTLIGAVRHKGFIPWDNDVDVSTVYEETIAKTGALKFYFTKLGFSVREKCNFTCSNFQIKIFKRTKNGVVGLDIFFIKKYKGNKIVNSEKDFMILNNNIKLAAKCFNAYLNNCNYSKLSIHEIRNKILEIENKIIDKGSSGNNQNIYYYGIDFPMNNKNGFAFKKEDIFPLKSIKFENLMLPCPNNVKKMLELQYGDYNQFPDSLHI